MNGKQIIATVLLGAGLFAGCDSKTDQPTQNQSEMSETPVMEVKQTPETSDERATIEEIFAQLESDYIKYLVQEDEPMFEFYDNRSEYINTFLKEMKASSSGIHLSERFLNQLEGEMENCSCDPNDLKSVRACAEPIFKCERVLGKIHVIAIDEEAGEAVVMAELKHQVLDDKGGKSSFLMEKQNGTWVILSRDLVGRESKVKAVPAEAMGTYINTTDASKTYVLKSEGGKQMLESCVNDECISRGTILGTKPNGQGSGLVIEGISGEMIPTWTLDGKKLLVHDYDAESDTWTDTEYQMN